MGSPKIMSLDTSPRSFILTPNASTLIPNYEIIREDAKIPLIDGTVESSKLSFLRGSRYKILHETMPLPAKRLLNIPREKINNWNNYIVHSMHCDYMESWRDHCKVPDNWTGPKLKKFS